MKINPRRIQVAVVDGALTFLGLALLCFGVWAVWKENLALAGTALGGGLVLLFAATIHRFESLKGLGMEAKTRELTETIHKAEGAVDQLKVLAEIVGSNILNLVNATGRLGQAPSIMSSYELSRQVKALLLSLGSDDAKVRAALTPWARWTLMDLFYVFNQRTNALLEKERERLTKDTFQPGEKLDAARQGMWRINNFQSHIVDGALTWEGSDVPDKLLQLAKGAPELSDAIRQALLVDVETAIAEAKYLLKHLDFRDQAYWQAISAERD